MLKLLRDASIRSIRRRVSQGDCPVEPALSVEVLEQIILDLADDQPPAAAGDESSITDAEIDKAIRHGFGDRTADAVAAEAVEREGWVLVPRVPTEVMTVAGMYLRNPARSLAPEEVATIWATMIAAAPASDAKEEG